MTARLFGTLLVIALVLLGGASSALAWDPLRQTGRATQAPTPAPSVDPAPFIAPPPGIYYVTDTYVADVVTTSGAFTAYTTTTVHESTGSYARVLDVVATGVSSVYDGAAFNGRRTLSDGRAIAGTYYQNYVAIDGRFVPVSIVFFQDDAEWRRLSAPLPAPGAASATPASPTIGAPPTTGCCPPTRPIAPPTPAPLRPIRPALSLLPVGAPLTRVEVLRGRPIAIWPRAFVDDREVPVVSWLLISGDAGDPIATSGRRGTAFVTSWARLAPPDMAYVLVFRIAVDTPESGPRTVDGTITVVVRAPALEPLS